ncbi:TIR domain-containing protein [Mycolicibacterium farcinogenes]|uniref:nSTAND1 domain-containing NTPase n=1 Tax=Mycolicibacterium farcinogenes TaxID=1802 RepID=UPI001C8E0DA2|nr:TIR domain-containing protein [Mycolicibacterium farcinogenes]QZH62464.1 TIR domain-containing protein [Mycolicibacterium farcinogenes]
MSRIFLSHSSADNRQAIALKAWLIEQDPGLADEIFFDLDRRTGIPAGVRWKEALRRANERCEAVICLLSDSWEASHECKLEYRHAEDLNKPIFTVRLQALSGSDITSEWQRCDVFGDGPKTSVAVDEGAEPVEFLTEGLLRLRDGLRAAGIGADTFAWPPAGEPDRAPYRGWQPLQEVDAAVYFGRDAQIGRALTVIRELRSADGGRLFVVLGPSGVGKSSFLRAGLLPRLRRDDRHFLPMPIVRPQRNALTGDGGLAQSIYDLRVAAGLPQPGLGEIKRGVRDVGRVRYWLTEAQLAAQNRILDPAGTAPPSLVLPIDQAEELFGVDAGEQAGAFLDVLSGLLDPDDDSLSLIVTATIRSDRYEPLQTAPQLATVNVRPFDDLKPMPQAQFKEVICGPARRAAEAGSRLSIAHELVDRLLEDWSRGADTLPLLSLTLSRLYRDYGDGEITLAEYQAMGGLPGVVENEIDELLAADPAARQRQLDVLRSAFVPWLATVNPDNDQPMRRVARWTDLPPESHALLDEFIARRLLVRDERDGETVVEVALESLLRQWGCLAEWLREEAVDLKGADNLERAARGWQQNGCSDEWLIPGSRLADAESLAAKPGFRERLNPTSGFLLASRQSEDRRLAAERQRHEAELQAAQALAAAESQAKEDAERHALALHKRNWILRAALALAVIAAVVAGLLNVRATRAEEQAKARARDAAANSLVANSETILSGARGLSDDVLGMQLALAVGGFPSNISSEYSILNALDKTRDVIKIIPTDGLSFAAVFSPDGKKVASGHGPFVQLWDTETWSPIGDFIKGHTGDVKGVAFSPDGKLIASTAGDATIRLWDTETRNPIGEPMRGHEGIVFPLAFSPDSSRIVTGGADKTVRLWDVAIRRQVGEPLRGHTSDVMSVAFSPDGKLIASGGTDKTLRLWHSDTGLPAADPLATNGPIVSSIAFSPDGRRIATGGGNVIQLWDMATRTPVGKPLEGHTAPINRVVYSRDGTRIASGSDDKTIRLWDANTGAPVGQPLTGHENGVAGLDFDPEGRRIVSTAEDDTLRVWDARGVQVLTGHDDAVTGADFRPDGKRIVSSGADQTIRQWDVDTGIQTGPLIRTGDAPAGVRTVVDKAQGTIGAAYLEGGRQILGVGVRSVRIWDAGSGLPVGVPVNPPPGTISLGYSEIGQKYATLAGDGGDSGSLASLKGSDIQVRNEAMQPIGSPLHHDKPVSTFTMTLDGQRVATASEDFQVRIWDTDTGQQIGKTLDLDELVLSVDFSSDGQNLAVATIEAVRIWNVDTGEEVGGRGLMGQDSWILDAAFSPDGSVIATGGSDGVVHLSDIATGRAIGPGLVGHTMAVSDVDFSLDGTKLISASADKTIRVWPVPTPSPEKLCDKMTFNMSRESWDMWVGPDIPYQKLCKDLPIAGEG